jgi:hypothetical protein
VVIPSAPLPRAVFPHLRTQEAGPGPVIDRLTDEHKIIHQALNDVDQGAGGPSAQPC